MNRLLTKTCLILFFGFTLLLTPASAAWLDPALEDAAEDAGADGFVNIFVVMKEQLDLTATLAEVDQSGGNATLRHYRVITGLQDVADRTQEPILTVLENGKNAKLVKSYKSFWITNAFAVEASPAFIEVLNKQPEIGSLYLDYPVELIEPVAASGPLSAAGKGIENGIMVSRAPELWALGIDGTGALACDQDTGADGSHPAFADRWRGLDAGVDPSAAWFDPLENETFPTESDWNEHGTHTLGTILGDDGAANQIGMAPGAKWIGAKTIDTGGDIFSDAVAAFEWMADPDGDPGTTDDVPDVCNNSWGLSQSYYGSCRTDFNLAVDAAEAAGVVVIFSAGNEGPSSQSLRSPGNRIAGDYNTFAIGALEQDGTTIADFSSRGPSDCDGATIKPEISAIGVDVRSAMPGGGYQLMSGTSMSGPHVSGAVVLLRSAFPEATPDEIKMALYFTAHDLGAAGEDNIFGMGNMDVYDAYFFLVDYFVNSDGVVDVEAAFTCEDTVDIEVRDADLNGASIDVTVWSTSNPTGKTVTLPATESEGVYAGSIEIVSSGAGPTQLLVQHGDMVTVQYIDADDGQGNFNVPKTTASLIDCQAPTFSGVQVVLPGDNTLTLSWDAAEDDTLVTYSIYRASASGGQNFDAPLAQTSATEYVDEDVVNMTTYYYVVRAADQFGQTETNLVEVPGTPVGPVAIWEEDWRAKYLHEWEIVDGNGDGATWTVDNPGGRSSSLMDSRFMIADSDHYGTVDMDEELISETIDVTGYTGVFLRFASNFVVWSEEICDVDVKRNGGDWETMLTISGDSQEAIIDVDLAQDDLTSLQLRFHYYNANYEYYWMIDNIQVMGWLIECEGNEECTDGLYCNGEESCYLGHCVPGATACPDDGLFCNGEESCNEDADTCETTGDPCDGLECHEDTDTCGDTPDDDDDNDNDDNDNDDNDNDDNDTTDDDDDTTDDDNDTTDDDVVDDDTTDDDTTDDDTTDDDITDDDDNDNEDDDDDAEDDDDDASCGGC